MSDLLLAIDIGNSSTALGLFEGGALAAQHSVANAGLATLPQRLTEALAGVAPKAVAVASVSPCVWEVVRLWSRDELAVPARRVRSDLPVAMPLRIECPHTLGDDRLMNAVAAYARARGAAIIVDFGTATTFEAVSAAGEFLGGAIAPGLKLAAQALYTETAQLPAVEPDAAPDALGRHTRASMLSGCFYGQVGLAKEMIARLKDDVGAEAKVYATGGAAALLAPHVPAIDEIVPALTLEGIRQTYLAAVAARS